MVAELLNCVFCIHFPQTQAAVNKMRSIMAENKEAVSDIIVHNFLR